VTSPMVKRGSQGLMPVNPETSLARDAEKGLETVAREVITDGVLKGKTYFEGALTLLAQDAIVDPGARTEFLDRIMGKPKQRNENLNIGLTLHGVLSQYADEDAVIDAEVVEDEPDHLT